MFRRSLLLFTVLFMLAGMIPSYSFAVSADSQLSGFTMSSGKAYIDPWFSTKYYADVGNAVSEITVTPTARNSEATIMVNGTNVPSGSASQSIALNTGSNTISILVKADAGSQTTYTLTVTRLGLPDSNANLSSLYISLENGIPTGFGFNPSMPYYDLNSVYVSKLLVKPVTADNRATVTVNGTVAASDVDTPVNLDMGNNTITVVVTSQDGTTTRTYSAKVVRVPSMETSLSKLTLSNGKLEIDPTDITKYFADVANDVSSITVTPTVRDYKATIQVNGKAVASGGTSETIALDVGSNTITILVTAEDGETKSTYTLAVNRTSSGPFTVTFDSKGGSAIASINGISPGAAIDAPAAPTRDGYTFLGWYKQSNNPWDFDMDKVNSDITLYAKWSSDSSANLSQFDLYTSDGASLLFFFREG